LEDAMMRYVCMVLAMAACLLNCGCPGQEGKEVANPVTRFTFDVPNRTMGFSNNKDVNVDLERATYTDKEGRSVEIQGLKIVDNASAVRLSNANQIAADEARLATLYAGLAKYTDAWAGLITATGGAVGNLMPALIKPTVTGGTTIETPWGSVGKTTTSTAGVVVDPAIAARLDKTDAALTALAVQIGKIAAENAATQPAKDEPETVPK
jgi:hypothetical protein